MQAEFPNSYEKIDMDILLTTLFSLKVCRLSSLLLVYAEGGTRRSPISYIKILKPFLLSLQPFPTFPKNIIFKKKFPNRCREMCNFFGIPGRGEGRFDWLDADREKILEALTKVALSSPNDAVALALNPEDCFVPGLDLWGVSEFKRGNGGSIEIKFADRVKAISLLLECMGGGEDGMAALIEALEN